MERARVAYLTTKGKIRDNYNSFQKCKFCRSLHDYGCGKYRLVAEFRRLHERAWNHYNRLQDEKFQDLITEIVSEFGELHLKVVKCAKSRSYLKRRLNYDTMDFDIKPHDSSFNETILAFSGPEEEIRQELEKLKKEKQQLAL